MSRESTTFALSKDRGNQLRSIALEKRISVAELVAGWIDRELIASNIPTDRAVVDIAVHEDGPKVDLVVELFGQHFLTCNPAQAGSLASSIDHVIDRGGTFLNMDAECVTVAKRGTGIVFTNMEGTFSRSMPVYEAREIANQLREAAEQYSAVAA